MVELCYQVRTGGFGVRSLFVREAGHAEDETEQQEVNKEIFHSSEKNQKNTKFCSHEGRKNHDRSSFWRSPRGVSAPRGSHYTQRKTRKMSLKNVFSSRTLLQMSRRA